MMVNLCFILEFNSNVCVDAFPRFVMAELSVSENVSEISVCIVLDIELEKSVVVEIRTEADTATGK